MPVVSNLCKHPMGEALILCIKSNGGAQHKNIHGLVFNAIHQLNCLLRRSISKNVFNLSQTHLHVHRLGLSSFLISKILLVKVDASLRHPCNFIATHRGIATPHFGTMV